MGSSTSMYAPAKQRQRKNGWETAWKRLRNGYISDSAPDLPRAFGPDCAKRTENVGMALSRSTCLKLGEEDRSGLNGLAFKVRHRVDLVVIGTSDDDTTVPGAPVTMISGKSIPTNWQLLQEPIDESRFDNGENEPFKSASATKITKCNQR